MTTKMQSCIDHIKTSTDVDPWAMEMVEQIITEYDKRFDQVLEIIDAKSREYIDWLNNRPHPDYGYHAAYIITVRDRIKKAVMELKSTTEE